jgi:glucokinase
MPAPLSLGFDLGGTQVRAALVQGGQVLKRAVLRTDVAGGPEAVMRQFQALAGEVIAGAAQPQAVGIAAPGPLDTVAGVVEHIPTLPGWEQFPLQDRLSDLFRLPAMVENDGIAAAYGEWQHGAGRGVANMIYATVSTGLGGGVIVDGHLLHGRKGMAAHIGHFRMDPAGPVCACGGAGCFEAFAAGTALGKRAQDLADGQPGSWLGQAARAERVTSRHVVEGARAGDADCLALLDEEARYLGRGFTSLAHIFSPDRIVMGGGVSAAFDLLTETIHATIRAEAMAPFKSTPVVAAQLGDNAGLVGVASLALDTLVPMPEATP